jgi:hypothetical protein
MFSTYQAQSELIEGLLPYFEHKRYELKAEKNQFIRSTNFGHSSALFAVSGFGKSVYVEFFLGLRIQEVEEHLIQIFGPSQYYHSNSHTIMTGWSNIWPSMLLRRYDCKSARDIEAITEMFIEFMDEKGFNFLDTYRKTQNLCTLLNDYKPDASNWNNHSYQHIFRALVLAHLTNRADHRDLYLTQRSYLTNRGNPKTIIEKFDCAYHNLYSAVIN